MKIKKRYAYVIVGLFILLGIFAVYAFIVPPGVGHPPSEIIVSIGGCDVILQDAIDNEWLKGIGTPICLSVLPPTYHLASEIVVTIDGYDITLQDAIDGSYFEGTGTISSSSASPFKGHSASEIQVTVDSVGMSLQDALSGLRASSCVPNTCGSLSYTCGGPYPDGCGGTVTTCGSCADSTCIGGTCIGECSQGVSTVKDCDGLDSSYTNFADVSVTCLATGYWDNPPCDIYYRWVAGTYSTPADPCSSVVTRPITCRRNDGVSATNSYCSGLSQPVASKTCYCYRVKDSRTEACRVVPPFWTPLGNGCWDSCSSVGVDVDWCAEGDACGFLWLGTVSWRYSCYSSC